MKLTWAVLIGALALVGTCFVAVEVAAQGGFELETALWVCYVKSNKVQSTFVRQVIQTETYWHWTVDDDKPLANFASYPFDKFHTGLTVDGSSRFGLVEFKTSTISGSQTSPISFTKTVLSAAQTELAGIIKTVNDAKKSQCNRQQQSKPKTARQLIRAFQAKSKVDNSAKWFSIEFSTAQRQLMGDGSLTDVQTGGKWLIIANCADVNFYKPDKDMQVTLNVDYTVVSRDDASTYAKTLTGGWRDQYSVIRVSKSGKLWQFYNSIKSKIVSGKEDEFDRWVAIWYHHTSHEEKDHSSKNYNPYHKFGIHTVGAKVGPLLSSSAHTECGTTFGDRYTQQAFKSDGTTVKFDSWCSVFNKAPAVAHVDDSVTASSKTYLRIEDRLSNNDLTKMILDASIDADTVINMLAPDFKLS